MRKNGSKILSLLLAFALLMSTFTVAASAATADLSSLLGTAVSSAQPEDGTNMALNKTASASGVESGTSHIAQHAFDGDTSGSRWSVDKIRNHAPQWLKVDLGEEMTFNQVRIYWEAAYASGYEIQVSNDNVNFTTVYKTEDGQGKTERITLDESATGRYVRLWCITRPADGWDGVSVYELELYRFTSEAIVNKAIAKLNVPKIVNGDFSVVVSDEDGASISWESDSDLLRIDPETGKVTVTAPAESTDVTLTAKVTYKDVTKTVSFTADVRSEAERQIEYTVYPVPQQVTLGEERITLTEEVNVVLEDGISEVTKARLEEVLDNAGLTYTYSAAPVADKTNLLLGVNGSGKAADAYATEHNISRNVFAPGENKFDMHIVQLNHNSEHGDFLLLGRDDDAAFYAIATLEQVLDQRVNGELTAVTFDDYANQQYRGMVEGFYGYPWSVQARVDWFEFAKKLKMNIFVYGPKGDPYHLGLWDEEYPDTVTDQERKQGVLTKDDIRVITAEAKKCNVDFVWVAHPAMQRSLNMSSNATVESEIENRLMPKFHSLYELGVREFGIFMDDITIGEGLTQKYTQPHLIDETQKRLYAKYNTADAAEEDKVKPLFYTPTWYTYGLGYADMQNQCMEAFKNSNVHEDVVICFTGDAVCGPINNSSCENFATRTGRKPCIWWNYPVNDYADAQLFMDRIDANFAVSTETKDMVGVIANPMNQAEASKVAFFGVADFVWNTKIFDSQKNWDNSFPYLIEKGIPGVSREELQEAYRVVCKNIVTEPEAKDMQELYTKFKAEYPLGELGTAKKMLATFKELNDGIAKVRLMKDCGDASYELLYTELEGNLNRLSDMALVIENSLTVLLSDDDDTRWAAFNTASKIQNEELSQSKNPRYVIHAMEDAGMSPTFKDYWADPSKNAMRPFVSYILTQATSAINNVTPVSREPRLFTNSSASFALENSGGTLSVTVPQGASLSRNEYVGVAFNKVRNLTGIADPQAEGLTLEYSLDGKLWTSYTARAAEPEAAFVRVKNNTPDAIALGAETLDWTVKPLGRFVSASVGGVGIYQSYGTQNLTDGNYNTKLWTADAQQAGQTVTMEYSDLINVNNVKLVFQKGNADSAKAAVVEISADNLDWKEIGSFTEQDTNNNNGVYETSGNGQPAKYVRIRLTQSASNWLQLFEFEVNKDEPENVEIPLAVTESGADASAVCDRDIGTSYTARSAGHVDYRLLLGLKVNQLRVLFQPGAEGEAPAVSVKSNGEWQQVGTLTQNPADFDVSAYANISDVRVSWTDSFPAIMEIIEDGEPYIEPDRVDLYQYVAYANSLNEEDYTADEWAAIQAALAAAEAKINGEASQDDVDAVQKDLEEAVGGVIEPTAHTLTVNFTTNAKLTAEDAAIANLIGKYELQLKAGDPYELTFIPRVEGREFAKILIGDADTSFEDTEAFTLTGTMGNANRTLNVQFTVVDKQVLRLTIEIAEGCVGSDEYNNAIPLVKEALDKALAAAKKVEADQTADQETINNAWSKLMKVMHYLQFATGNKDGLDDTIIMAEGLLKENYTSESWAVLEAAYAKALEVQADKNAMEKEIKEAADALYNAIMDLDFAANFSWLEKLVGIAGDINLDEYLDLDGDDFKTFRDALAAAEEILLNKNATQVQVDKAAETLDNAIAALRKIPTREALETRIEKAESIPLSKYTDDSVAMLEKALDDAKDLLLNDPDNGPARAKVYYALGDAMEGLKEKTVRKSSGSAAKITDNSYGIAGTAIVGAASPFVRSDTTVDFTVRRGAAYCFKMTVVNGNGLTPSFTVGNGDVLKTQYVTRIGNDYYFRVWAVGTPGQSAGVYTQLTGQNPVKHCTVKVA
ncbi:beta-N-acetylglucosaminidase domain-containing protein [Clostridium sp. D33t1_170424_F3]|uniref:beta-N-acetylglucosaminidase domain-containing protein n=1 Tax=Clostridium sp. D33t1_170424_F3 TaxID=2787099 RepID=UPI0018AA077B|nr:beta-N-acetylglucosaminidase domain-containing protein [Clostridium sp. D33t1_170424_F3]